MISWNNILDTIDTNRSRVITVDPEVWDLSNPNYNKILTLWQDNNVNLASIKWTNYYLDCKIQDLFAEQLGCSPLRSWISKIDPGYMTGWHWDVDENEPLYLSAGQVVRYTCFIDKPKLGHTFIIGNDCYHNMPQGSIVEWKKYNEWHCGSNGGLTPNYMFHLVGVKGSNL